MYYIIIHPRGNLDLVSVADLQYEDEKPEFRLANKETFYHRDDAIRKARMLSALFDKEYQPFVSRYDSEENEDLGEFLSVEKEKEVLKGLVAELNLSISALSKSSVYKDLILDMEVLRNQIISL